MTSFKNNGKSFVILFKTSPEKYTRVRTPANIRKWRRSGSQIINQKEKQVAHGKKKYFSHWSWGTNWPNSI